MKPNIFTQDLSVHSEKYLKVLNIIELVTLILLSFYYSKNDSYPNLNSMFYTAFPAIILFAYLWTSFTGALRGESNDELNKSLLKAFTYMKTDAFIIWLKSFIYVFYPFIMPLFTGLLYGREGLRGGIIFGLFTYQLTIPFLFVVNFMRHKYTTKKQVIIYAFICLVIFMFSPSVSFSGNLAFIGYISYFYCFIVPYYNTLMYNLNHGQRQKIHP